MKAELREESTRIVDELADEVAELISNSRKVSQFLKTAEESDSIQKRNLSEISNLKERISALENRMEKYISSFKIVATEVERQITEKSEINNKENEQQIMRLQSQIENLRTSMIRLSSEVKRIQDKLKNL